MFGYRVWGRLFFFFFRFIELEVFVACGDVQNAVRMAPVLLMEVDMS